MIAILKASKYWNHFSYSQKWNPGRHYEVRLGRRGAIYDEVSISWLKDTLSTLGCWDQTTCNIMQWTLVAKTACE